MTGACEASNAAGERRLRIAHEFHSVNVQSLGLSEGRLPHEAGPCAEGEAGSCVPAGRDGLESDGFAAFFMAVANRKCAVLSLICPQAYVPVFLRPGPPDIDVLVKYLVIG